MFINDFHISYSPEEADNVIRLHEELYKEDLRRIEEVVDNSITFKTLYAYEGEMVIEVKVLIFNSTNNDVNFDYLPLMIINNEDEVVACEYINLTSAGVIPPRAVRPYSVYFNKNSIIGEKSINNECKLLVNISEASILTNNKACLDYVDDNITLYEKQIIKRYIENTTPVKKDNLSIIPFKSSIDENKQRYTILIVSNGYDKEINLDGVNLIYKDIAELIYASKKINNLPKVSPNSISVFKIVLGDDDVVKEPFNPERCNVSIV